MFENLWGALLLMISSILLVFPFGIAAIYFFVSLRQLFIGAKEKASWKLKGGVKPLVISALTLAIIIYIWLYVWVL